MSTSNISIAQQVKKFCTQVGADPLLVQGAGGNVSWKDGDLLWVKASGTWLAEAETKEIFVPVNLVHLQNALAKQDFFVKPEVVNGESNLRPSIETLLHALMPHKVVVHLHAVEILTHLVQFNAVKKIKSAVGDSAKWIYVDYFKPGADLAKAISNELIQNPRADVVFMGSHGVVVGGNGVEEILSTFRKIIEKLEVTPPQLRAVNDEGDGLSELLEMGYVPCSDQEMHQLAINDRLSNRLRYDWSLYPDHIIFLGAKAAILDANFTKKDLMNLVKNNPPFIFSIKNGLYQNVATTQAQKAQLRCYFDVVVRQDFSAKLISLNDHQVAELLNWEAEKYRQDYIGI